MGSLDTRQNGSRSKDNQGQVLLRVNDAGISAAGDDNEWIKSECGSVQRVNSKSTGSLKLEI